MTAAIERQASTALLNRIYEDFAAGTPEAAVHGACETFRLLRSQMQPLEWAEFRQTCVSQHPVRHLLQRHLPLTQTFRNRSKQLAQELNAIAQDRKEATIFPVERLPLTNVQQRFDFVYAADLFDVLDTLTAAKLLPLLVQMLQPDGRLLVANVAPGVPEAAYLEVCTNRVPQYRSEEEIAALTAFIPEEQISSQYVYRDEVGGTVFLEIQRAAP